MMPFTFRLPDEVNSDFPQEVICYNSEQAIMLCKAALMKDRVAFDELVKIMKPHEAKAIGRKVEPWDEELWVEKRDAIAFNVLRQKFNHPYMRQKLLDTGDAILVEASPNDCIWGVGLGIEHEDIMDPSKWRGMNLLGEALMQVRQDLAPPKLRRVMSFVPE